MLVQYTVENFKSIKEEVVINFSVGKKYQDSKWVVNDDNTPIPLYKCIGLVGPNASGKSNIISSFTFALSFILNTISRKDTSKIKTERFAFGSEMYKKPTSFEFIFYKNAIKYVYGFSINEKEVIEEYLLGYFSAKPKTLFDRTAGQHYDFKGNSVKTQNEIAQKTNANRLYMPVAAEWGYAPLKEVYTWFEFISRQYNDFSVSEMIRSIITDEKRKDIFIQELQRADFNIKDIYIKNQKFDQKSIDLASKILSIVHSELKEQLRELSIPESKPTIRVVHENHNGDLFDIDLDEDSAGTESIVENIAEFLYLSENGGLIIEDELGKSYHTKLTQHFLKMFQSPTINPGNSQLLFTTHDTKALNLLNPDQFYLVDKDESGATFIKLLDDYTIRENDNIELGYLKGRYGSIPYMKG